MKKIYADNGLPFWTEQDILERDYVTRFLSKSVQSILSKQNRSWLFERIEAPCIIPSDFVSSEYDPEDYFHIIDDAGKHLDLRPETTASSYEYLKQLFESNEVNPPYCVWQLGKSFRHETDQVSRNMRYKEFYQLEFQSIFTKETKNNYQDAVLEPLAKAVTHLTGKDARIVKSDRLPSYSASTMDIEVNMEYKWLEVCSISLRNDVPFDWKGKELQNLEVAFGADRLVNVIGDNS